MFGDSRRICSEVAAEPYDTTTIPEITCDRPHPLACTPSSPSLNSRLDSGLPHFDGSPSCHPAPITSVLFSQRIPHLPISMSHPEGGKKAPLRVKRLKYGVAKQNIDVPVDFKPEVTFHLMGFTPIIYSNPVVVIAIRFCLYMFCMTSSPIRALGCRISISIDTGPAGRR